MLNMFANEYNQILFARMHSEQYCMDMGVEGQELAKPTNRGQLTRWIRGLRTR